VHIFAYVHPYTPAKSPKDLSEGLSPTAELLVKNGMQQACFSSSAMSSDVFSIMACTLVEAGLYSSTSFCKS